MPGLSSADAAERLSRVGPNALPEQVSDSIWRRFLRQSASPLIYVLLFALAFDLSLWLSEGGPAGPLEAGAIALTLLLNAALGLDQDRRSEAPLARLKAFVGAHAWGLRDGQLVRVATLVLVP